MYYVLCIMYYVLCIMYFLLTTYYIIPTTYLSPRTTKYSSLPFVEFDLLRGFFGFVRMIFEERNS